MNKLFFLLFITALLSLSASAKKDSTAVKKEYSNSIIFSGTSYYFPGEIPSVGALLFWRDDQIGVYYERKINKHFKVKMGYNRWNSSPLYHNLPIDEFSIIPHNDTLRSGSVDACVKYKMIDASVLYVFNVLKRHKISVGIGLSYTWGINDVIDSITFVPGYYDALIFSGPQKNHYYGIVPEVGYDYLFLKNRVSVGFDLRYRRYFGFYLNTFEYGFHAGFNF